MNTKKSIDQDGDVMETSYLQNLRIIEAAATFI